METCFGKYCYMIYLISQKLITLVELIFIEYFYLWSNWSNFFTLDTAVKPRSVLMLGMPQVPLIFPLFLYQCPLKNYYSYILQYSLEWSVGLSFFSTRPLYNFNKSVNMSQEEVENRLALPISRWVSSFSGHSNR